MEQYCAGWSYPGGLCTPELIKLISNCYLVLFAAVLWLLSFRRVSTKRLVRFWSHNLQYVCLMGTVLLVIIEIIAWHTLFGSERLVVLNSVLQVFGTGAAAVLYAGGERTAKALPLVILSASHITSLAAHVTTIVILADQSTAQDAASLDVRVYVSAIRAFFYFLLITIHFLNIIKRRAFWKKVADRDTCNKHWTAALPSRLTFSWLTGLLIKGWKKPLEMSDIGEPPMVDKCGPLTESFERMWAEEVKKKDPSLILVCVKLFKSTYIYNILFRVLGDGVIFLSPYAVSGINIYILTVQNNMRQESSSPDLSESSAILTDRNLSISEIVKNGYLLCFVIFVSGVFQSILSARYSMFMDFWRAVHVRAILRYTVFKKALRLAPWASKDPDLTQGKILNVVNTDTQQYHFLFYFLNTILVCPVLIIACIVVMLLDIGWVSLIGILVLFASFPVNAVVARKMGECQRKVMAVKDKRMKVMNEMLLSMKSIKMYCWESVCEKMIVDARKEEKKILRRQMIYRTFFIFIANIMPTFMACSIFVVYSVTSPIDPGTGKREPLTTAMALRTLALLNILRLPFIILPFAISSYVSARACAQRIIKYLKAPELPISSDMPSQNPVVPDSTDTPSETAVQFNNVTLCWDTAKDAAVILQGISVKIPRSKLTIVVGEVGAGKTAFVNAILNEMHIQSGSVTRNIRSDKISYASQTPWILNSTVQENITFGQPLDEKRYKEVIAATCLDMDLKTLPAGDQTEIGERGINLSGGQRQRVSVARALYAPSDLVILDDPLSALDAHVGATLFEKGIQKFLAESNRTVVLITHHLQYLQDADLVIEVDHGKLSYVGDHTQYEKESQFYLNFLENLANKTKEKDSAGEKVLGEDSAVAKLKKQESQVEASQKEKGGLITEEEREKGAVKLQVYMVWAYAAGASLILSLAILLASQVGRIIVDYWITVWTDKRITGSRWQDSDSNYIVTYIGLALLSSLLTYIGTMMMVFDGLRASQSLFKRMLMRIMKATPRFFDITPLGRIINRFSNDVTVVDIQLIESTNSAYSLFARVICVMIMQIYASYYMGIAVVPILLIYYVVQQIYITTSREIQRLNSNANSPIMAFFSESLGGLSTIRAYLKVSSFQSRMEKYIDVGSNTFMMVKMVTNWVGFRLDLIGVMTATISGLVCVVLASTQTSDDSFLISASDAGLALTFALTLPGELNWMMTNISLVELNMNAVERMNNYATVVPVEEDDGKAEPGPSWPSLGEIQFLHYFGSYSKELDNVLVDVSVTIPAGKRVGICGRTGSGKSSLMIAIFRLLTCKSGTIKIDGVDIMDLTLNRLREALTIIPQDPLLFAGTIRYNLDPTETATDEEVWSVLERVNMKQPITDMKGLDTLIEGSGDNFSVGQRQLLCLARAFLRNSKIIIMDEATASIDLETDEKIQKVLRSEFVGRTMLVIAHRISSIADSDLILVMNKGKVSEFDSPANLLKDPNSMFSGLITSNVL